MTLHIRGVSTLEKPVIIFKEYRISKIDYSVVDESEQLELYREDDKQITLTIGYNEEKDAARLIVGTTVIDDANLRVGTIEITGYFDINPDTEEDQVEHFLVQNGTAILFPYLRAIVSFVTSLDNDNAIILPTINTTTFSKEMRKK